MDFLSANIKEIIAIPLSYLIGCITTGYYLVRYRTGEDIRKIGSESVGATNVKRVLGWRGFFITLIGDAVKGLITVGGSVYFNLEMLGIIIVFILVIIGHIWPFQLNFRGGKGIATFIGALLIFDYQLSLIIVMIFGVLLLLSRKYTLSGLIAIILTPLFAFILGHPLMAIIGITIIDVIILIAHRDNIRAILQSFQYHHNT